MKRLIIVLFVGLLISCSNKTNKINEKLVDADYFSYSMEFRPSFMPPSTISIIKKDKIGLIKFTVYNSTHINKALRINYADSIALSQDDFKYFFSTLDTISLIKMKTNRTYGLDGIIVFNTFYQDTIKNAFSFWSPEKGSKEHKIAETVIRLSQKKFTAMKQQEYLESLELYFDFGLTCKKICDNPCEVRIYGYLSLDKEKELNKFISELPSDQPILIDMTNFHGMDEIHYPLFKSLITRNTKIVWVTEYKEQLKEIGVDTVKIIEDIDTAKQLMK